MASKRDSSPLIWSACDVFHNRPVNKAHLEERYAMQLIEQCKWDDAIGHYKRASQYIFQAMEATVMTEVKKSLQLQYDNYLHQQEVVEIRRREAATLSIENKTQLEDGASCNTNATNVTPDNKVQINKKFEEMAAPVSHLKDCREPDSLLQFLTPSKVLGNHRRFPKAVRDRIEELEIQNQNLIELVKTIIDEKEKLENINSYLTKKNGELQEELADIRSELKSCLQTQDADTDHVEQVQPPHFFTDSAETPMSILRHHPSCFEFDERLRMRHQLDCAMQDVLLEEEMTSDTLLNDDVLESPANKDTSNLEANRQGDSCSSETQNVATNAELKSVKYEELEDT